MEDEWVWLEECLCSCEVEDSRPQTWSERLWYGTKFLIGAVVFTCATTLIAIGFISVWFSIVLS